MNLSLFDRRWFVVGDHNKPLRIAVAGNKRMDRMVRAAGFRFSLLGTAVLSALCMGIACAHDGSSIRDAGEICVQKEINRLEGLPEKAVITTLDAQQIRINDFLGASLLNQPGCSLPYKFYHWPNEEKGAVSKGRFRIIKHRIRAYYNLTSTCYPEKREAGQVYGDVAEFYDEDLVFMGFAVYVGKGHYCPLPHAGYNGPASLEAAMLYRIRGNNATSNLNERKEG